ncbi:hypothetical protein GAY33_08840 [Azospirillum brasilense]|uniref:hypothetical protein n=1 Tax=Azospirillum argentinense TaxID=2970906 RepID=UPI00190BA613|nr:hypothetical protein [Azospirillum argentinense]MBK3799332.1 hypothetical protein [Azospirillum argentinense]
MSNAWKGVVGHCDNMADVQAALIKAAHEAGMSLSEAVDYGTGLAKVNNRYILGATAGGRSGPQLMKHFASTGKKMKSIDAIPERIKLPK